MQRILFVIASLHYGGAERALSNIITHFPDDWQMDILINNETMIEFPYKGKIISLSLPVFGDKKSPMYFLKETIKRTITLKKLKKENQYDACISFLDSANISNVLSGNKYCKTIVSIRSNMIEKPIKCRNRVRNSILIKMLYCHADRIITVSKEIEQGLVTRLRVPREKVHAIVNGYDCKAICDQAGKEPSGSQAQYIPLFREKDVVVTVGRLCSSKGQWHLIRAFTDVIKKKPDALLFVVGTGPLEGYLSEIVKSYGIENNVILAGYSNNPFWYMANAKVFILPSMYEGYPNSLAEAVCCGVPCIATDFHSGAREILAPSLDPLGDRVKDISEEEYGILIPVCSGKKYKNNEPLEPGEKKMADILTMVLGNTEKQEYYKHKNRERSKMLDIDSIVSEWIDEIKA